MSRRHICDVPGCARERKSWQRLCDACFNMLPGDIRTGITSTFRTDKRAHRTWCRRAAEHFNGPASTQPRVAPETVYQRNARMMGEHDEAA